METKTNSHVFRFNFSVEMSNELDRFTKVNNYLTVSEYKSNWEDWVSENEGIIEEENTRLKELGYIGDIYIKMYKSARYYLRKKCIKSNTNIQSKRRKYVPISKTLLNVMDNYIVENLTTCDLIKPSQQYQVFIDKYNDLITRECNDLDNEGLQKLTKEDLVFKIKKTYKNRYYLITHK